MASWIDVGLSGSSAATSTLDVGAGTTFNFSSPGSYGDAYGFTTNTEQTPIAVSKGGSVDLPVGGNVVLPATATNDPGANSTPIHAISSTIYLEAAALAGVAALLYYFFHKP